jgi:hypothetical protein
VSLKKVSADWDPGTSDAFDRGDLDRLEIGHLLGHAHVE